jgi:hypothetical protein
VHAGLYDASVIEHHKGTGRQITGKVVEQVVSNLPMLINKQFGVVALWQRIFGYAIVGQGIVIVVD